MSDITEKEKQMEEYYKNLVSKIIIRVYNDQQKIINKLKIEIIQLKALSKKESYDIDTSDDSE